MSSIPPSERLVLTCEHAGNRVPAGYRDRFRSAGRLLQTHRGYDIGALAVARRLARDLSVPLYYSTVSRLLVDLNRSESHPRLFSEFVRELDLGARDFIRERYYAPYRRQVEDACREKIRPGRVVLHLSIHSFTPVFEGRERNADLGLLYDPSGPVERAFAGRLRAALAAGDPAWRVRRNYPYRGVADGLTTHLRGRFGPERYAGIEIEINQARLRSRPARLGAAGLLGRALAEVLGGTEPDLTRRAGSA